jgi:hypothetical protein
MSSPEANPHEYDKVVRPVTVTIISCSSSQCTEILCPRCGHSSTYSIACPQIVKSGLGPNGLALYLGGAMNKHLDFVPLNNTSNQIKQVLQYVAALIAGKVES